MVRCAAKEQRPVFLIFYFQLYFEREMSGQLPGGQLLNFNAPRDEGRARRWLHCPQCCCGQKYATCPARTDWHAGRRKGE